MQKVCWLMAGAVAVVAMGTAANAQDVRYTITPRPAPPTPVVDTAMNPTAVSGNVSAPVTMPGPYSAFETDVSGAQSCGTQRGAPLRRVCDWLLYRPLATKCKSCQTCASCCPPPVYAFFPCQSVGASCNTCASGPVDVVAAPITVYYTKAADVPVIEPLVQAEPVSQTSAQVETEVAAKPAEPAYHPTTYKPANIAKTMPVLPPTLFRSPPAKQQK